MINLIKERELCDFCGGELLSGKKDLEFKVKGEMVLCQDIPSKICTECGEAYLDAETSEKVEWFLKSTKQVRPSKYIPMAVYEPSLVLR
ncbi:type II toxin-antitoxin system MqsA family antitoxin [bacterium]|nr:type II toxin-antitoxin system MqsA family antitoxin [bacterium]MBU1614578.1 type II toxin-antitoxin system MqsA family antitoxin [bacterium]